MNNLILVLALLLFPSIIGCGAVKAYLSIKSKIIKADSLERESAFCRLLVYFSTGGIVILAVAGLTNLFAVFTNLPISSAGKYFNLITLCLSIASALFVAIRLLIQAKTTNTAPKKHYKKNFDYKADEIIFFFAAIAIAAVQIFIVGMGKNISYLGDQTIETVISFINTDRIYSVDPLTGSPYLNGYPFRLALQCLPFLYSVLCTDFNVSPTILVWHIMPVFWLICGYATIYRIADSLFSRFSRKLLMLVIFELLLWCNDATSQATGFNIFHSGYSAVIVLELLLIYWTIGSLLSRNTFAALITIAVEPMVASTKLGIGACFFIIVAFTIISRIPFTKCILASIERRTGGDHGEN